MALAVPDTNQIVAAIASVSGVELEAPVTVATLAGGYAWHTLGVTDAFGRDLVVRLAPAGGTMEPYVPSREAAALAAAWEHIPAPKAIGFSDDSDLLGTPFLVETKVEGAVVSLSSVATSERALYQESFAATLGDLHSRSDPGPMGGTRTVNDAYRAELESMIAEYRRVALHRHPGLENGLSWLRQALPDASASAVVCHGDYRFANITWTGPGLIGAVLDWERAWVGDPMADVAFTRLFSGWCAIDDDIAASYTAASGVILDEARIEYALRFERVRAYFSPLRLMKAIHERRVSDPRLVEIAEAGEAGIWELLDWDAPALSVVELPANIGLDWTGAVTDPEQRSHFDNHPRPLCADPDALEEARRAWADRPTLKRKRTWQ